MTEFGNSVELVSSCSAGVPPARWVGGTPTRKKGATHHRFQILDFRF